MPPVEALSTFIVSAFLFILSPGPSNFYIISRSVSQGTSAGIVAAFGLASGLMLHAFTCAFGVSAIFTYSPLSFIAVKVFGAAYLVYIGVMYWSDKDQETETSLISQSKSNVKIYQESVLIEVTNPNVALFF